MTRFDIRCDTRGRCGTLKSLDFRAWRSLRESNPCLRRERAKSSDYNGECHNSALAWHYRHLWTVSNVTNKLSLKYIKHVNGRYYFRKTFKLGSRRVTTYHPLSHPDHPDFWPEYSALMMKHAEDKRAPKASAKPAEGGDDLYVIQVGAAGQIKIGRSKDVHVRLKTIQTSQQKDVRLLVRAVGMGHAERDIHRAFAVSRLRGEWFRWDKHTKMLVAMLRAGVDWRRAAPETLDAARKRTGAIGPDKARDDAWASPLSAHGG